jgi:hypothetical protein
VAFVWTCALELPVYTVLVGRRFGRWWSVCVLTLLVNLATHPALWFRFPRFEPPAAWFVAGEAGVTAVEGVLIAAALARSMPVAAAIRAGAVAALAANGFSATFGWLDAVVG